MSPTARDELLVDALVKLRHRIAGDDARLTQAEAQVLYMAVLARPQGAPPGGGLAGTEGDTE